MATDNDLAVSNRREVKGMRRLAGLHHGVIGGVHDIVDASQPDGFQPLDHPFGRRSHLDAFDDPGGIAAAQVGFVYLDLGQL